MLSETVILSFSVAEAKPPLDSSANSAGSQSESHCATADGVWGFAPLPVPRKEAAKRKQQRQKQQSKRSSNTKRNKTKDLESKRTQARFVDSLFLRFHKSSNDG